MPFTGSAVPAVDTERRLVARSRRGDPAAFRGLFEQHSPAVWRFLRDLLRDEAAADEATQETFVRAHARLGALRDDTRFVSWLLGIARHVYLESRRGQATHLDVASEENEPLLEAMRPSPTPETWLLDRELEGLLSEALGEVREERRAALLLRIDHGLAYEDIAQVMGWSLPKVKNEIHRARLQLRERLAGHVGTGGRP
ncbi:DNA-directed RNA polymerase sigma-70 factor [Cystobacter fuscus]|uniref:DNA-directed RNA polymerase sigma-70 factor n=1 Tax=Cystobacter fuscus TaxID=43 RepID=A0A250IUU8_9BACT|nr:RNA polymerase sigma factor [Cystobacter fuscus]ATB34931.1 DNA-directed RNA polymerase sigma-70 factor [Cystobacter fuscus]